MIQTIKGGISSSRVKFKNNTLRPYRSFLNKGKFVGRPSRRY